MGVRKNVTNKFAVMESLPFSFLPHFQTLAFPGKTEAWARIIRLDVGSFFII